jgi:hypothetical protein
MIGIMSFSQQFWQSAASPNKCARASLGIEEAALPRSLSGEKSASTGLHVVPRTPVRRSQRRTTPAGAVVTVVKNPALGGTQRMQRIGAVSRESPGLARLAVLHRTGLGESAGKIPGTSETRWKRFFGVIPSRDGRSGWLGNYQQGQSKIPALILRCRAGLQRQVYEDIHRASRVRGMVQGQDLCSHREALY